MISFPVLIQGFQMISRRKLTFSRKFQGIPATLLTKHVRMNDWVFSIFELRIQYPYTAWKVSKSGVISGPYFPVFGPEISLYLETFHAVKATRKTYHFHILRISFIKLNKLSKKVPQFHIYWQKWLCRNEEIWGKIIEEPFFCVDFYLSKENIVNKTSVVVL